MKNKVKNFFKRKKIFPSAILAGNLMFGNFLLK